MLTNNKANVMYFLMYMRNVLSNVMFCSVLFNKIFKVNMFYITNIYV